MKFMTFEHILERIHSERAIQNCVTGVQRSANEWLESGQDLNELFLFLPMPNGNHRLINKDGKIVYKLKSYLGHGDHNYPFDESLID